MAGTTGWWCPALAPRCARVFSLVVALFLLLALTVPCDAQENATTIAPATNSTNATAAPTLTTAMANTTNPTNITTTTTAATGTTTAPPTTFPVGPGNTTANASSASSSPAPTTVSPTANSTQPTTANATTAATSNNSSSPTSSSTSTMPPVAPTATAPVGPSKLPFNPNNPCVPCELLPDEFLDCDPPGEDAPCDFGASSLSKLKYTNVTCRVLPNIECYGPAPMDECTRTDNVTARTFVRQSVPCIKYTGHYFLTTLLFSIFLGICAVDRFCLGYKCSAAGKLLTLGGIGVWWIVDIVLLITGNLHPADDSSWEPYY